jgi:hypothetical protein
MKSVGEVMELDVRSEALHKTTQSLNKRNGLGADEKDIYQL